MEFAARSDLYGASVYTKAALHGFGNGTGTGVLAWVVLV